MAECKQSFDISLRDEQYTIQVAAMNNKGELVDVPVISKVNSEWNCLFDIHTIYW